MCDDCSSYQSGSGIIAAAAWKTPASHIGDEGGESHADGAGQQDGGVRPLHHPMKHKGLSGDIQCKHPVGTPSNGSDTPSRGPISDVGIV